MALFNSRKKSDPSQPSGVATPAPVPEQTPAQPAQFSAAPLGAGLRLVSAPGATVTELPIAEPKHQEPRAEDLRGLPLGTILYRRGLVEQSELEEALAAGMESGERLGEVLISRALVSEEEIGRCLAAQQGLRFLNAGEFTVDPDAARLLPASEALELGALAVSMQDNVLLVVSPDPSAHQRGRLEAVLGHPVTEAVVSRAVFALLVEQVENGSVDAAQGESAPAPVEQQHDAGWLVPEPADEPAPPALEVAPTPEEEFTPFPEAVAELHRPESEEEQQMEAWTQDEALESGDPGPDPGPAAWSEPMAEPAPEQPAQELGSWNGDGDGDGDGDGTTGTAHLEPVADEPFADEPVADEPVADLPSWDAPAAETVHEEHSSPEAFSPEPEPAPTHSEHAESYSEPEHAVAFDGSVPDEGRIEELGAHHAASVGRIDELLNRIHEGAATYHGLRAQIGELTDNLKTTEEALADREQRLGALTEEHDAAQRRIDELVGELHQRDEALSGLGERLEDLTGRLGSAEQRLDEREQRLAELDASLVERVRHVEELSAQVERRDHALSSFEEKLAAIATQFVADGAA